MKTKKFWKKKKFWISVVVVVVVIAGGGVVLQKQRMNAIAQELSSAVTVQSSEVTTGDISNTISGSGNLAIAETENVKAPAGIKIDEVYVESGDTVEEGQKLASINTVSIAEVLITVNDRLDAIDDELDDDDDLSSLEIEVLKAERTELKAYKAELVALRENPVIVATTAGVISSVNVSEGEETSSGSSSSGSTTTTSGGMTGAAVTTESVSMMLLSTSPETESSSESETVGETESSSESETTATQSASLSALKVTAPVTGEKPQSAIVATDAYKGVITWYEGTDITNDSKKIADTTAFSGSTVYTAKVVLQSKDGYILDASSASSLAMTSVKDSSYTIDDDTMTLTLTFNETAAAETQAPSGTDAGNTGAGTDAGTSNGTGSGSLSGLSGSSSGGTSGSTSTASATSGSSSSGTDSVSQNEMIAFVINKTDNVVVSLSVDELDITSVSVGQTVSVTLDAIDGETFEGEITNVADSATSSSGSAKYAVEVTIPMSDAMRIGMSATAVINISESTGVLTIPMTALQQKGDEIFVYTENNDGTLGGETVVETGLSDGTNVEITSGLSEGDTVYYTRTSSNTSSSDDASSFFGGGMQGGGEMPSGGSMPSGGGDSSGRQGGGQGGGMPSQN